MAKKAKSVATVVFTERTRPCGTDLHSVVSTDALLWHSESLVIIKVVIYHKEFDECQTLTPITRSAYNAAHAQRIAIAEADKVMAEADQHLETYRENLRNRENPF